jgi:SPP1 gp7 family putative phage head morphogenesis protein
MMKNPAAFVQTMSDLLGATELQSRIDRQKESTRQFAKSTLDAQSRRQRQREAEHFAKIKNSYYGYASKLRRIARHVADIIRAYPPGDPEGVAAINRYLRDYAYILRPWARAAGALMVGEVSRRDYTAWVRHARMMNRELRKELLQPTVTGEEMRRIIDEQVELITSIPLEAAERVQRLSQEYWTAGKRYDVLRSEILNSSAVTYNRASLIARTETAKTASAVTQSRAQYIGSTHYIWRTSLDKDVREMHKKLEGRVCSWDDPPVAEANGERHHPGNFPNCRPSCWASPILPPPEEIGA